MEPTAVPQVQRYDVLKQPLDCYGEFIEFPGVSNCVLHPRAVEEKGGLYIADETGAFPKVIKEILVKIAAKAAKGEITSLLSIGSAAYVHFPGSHLSYLSHDFS